MNEQSTPSRPQKASDGRTAAHGGHGAKPDAVRERAVLALLSERTVADAARRCGVGERTLRRWLSDDVTFKDQYDSARAATFQFGLDRIQALMGRAVDTLQDLLSAKKFPSVRLGAARTIAEIAIHQRDAETILKRLDEIERAQRERYVASNRRR